MQKILYKLFAPILRTIYKSKITSKEIVSTQLRMYYNVGQHLNYLGKRRIHYEPENREAITQFIKKGDTIFDIGANIGQYSLYLSTLLGHEGKLISIEPDSDNFSFLLFNITKNKCKNIHAYQYAVGEENNKVIFYKDTVTGGRMSSLNKFSTGTSFKGETEEVDMIRLKDLIDEHGIPDFIKIDVEGAEASVLENLDERLDKTIFFIEVRADTKQQVFKIFSDKSRNVFLIKKGIKPILNSREIPDFANLIIR